MEAPFRLYGLSGCGFCKKSFEYLRAKGVPFQYFTVDGDPLMLEGAKVLTGGDAFPLLITTVTGETLVIKGFDEGNYERVTAAFLASTSAKSTYKVAEPSQYSGQAEKVAEQQKPTNGKASALPAVSGLLDSDSGDSVADATGDSTVSV